MHPIFEQALAPFFPQTKTNTMNIYQTEISALIRKVMEAESYLHHIEDLTGEDNNMLRIAINSAYVMASKTLKEKYKEEYEAYNALCGELLEKNAELINSIK